jgi:hypothetical protein
MTLRSRSARPDLPPTFSHTLRGDLLLEETEALTRQLERIERELNGRVGKSLAILCLRSIPGFGIRTAEAIEVFIDDPNRSVMPKRLLSTSASRPGRR